MRSFAPSARKHRSEVGNKRWTEEEDALVREYGARMNAEKLRVFLEERTGIPRSKKALQNRRMQLDNAWYVDPVGYISFYDVAGLGSNGKSRNRRAFRKAQADGVLRWRYLRGKKRMLVPTWWADEWIAFVDRERAEIQALRAAGWMTTPEVGKLIGKGSRQATMILRHFSKPGRMYEMFANVQGKQLHDTSWLWEPNSIREAVRAYQVKCARSKPRGWWGLQRTADELNVYGRALRPLVKWLVELGFEREVSHMTDGFDRRFWNPQQVRAFRMKHAAVIDAKGRAKRWKRVEEDAA